MKYVYILDYFNIEIKEIIIEEELFDLVSKSDNICNDLDYSKECKEEDIVLEILRQKNIPMMNCEYLIMNIKLNLETITLK